MHLKQIFNLQLYIQNPYSKIRNPRPEDALKDGHIRGRSRLLMKHAG